MIKTNLYAKNVNSFNYITDRLGSEITVLNPNLKKVMTYNKNNNEDFYEVKEQENSDVVMLCKSTKLDNKKYNYRMYDLDGKYKNLDFETDYAYNIYFDGENYIFNLGNSFIIFNKNAKKVIENVTAFRYYYNHYVFSYYTNYGLHPTMLIYDSDFNFIKKIDNYQDDKILEHDEKFYDWFVNIEGENYYRINSPSSGGVNIINKNMELVFPEPFFDVKDKYSSHIIEALYKGHRVTFDCISKTVLNILIDDDYVISKEKEDKLNEIYGDKLDKIEYSGEVENRYIIVIKKDKSKDIYTKDLRLVAKNVGLIEYNKINDYIFTSEFRITNVLDKNLNQIKNLVLNYSNVKNYSFGNQNIYVFYNNNNDFVDIYNSDFSKVLKSVKIFNIDLLDSGVLALSKDMDVNKNYILHLYDFDLNNLYDQNGEKKVIKKAKEFKKIERFSHIFYYKTSITTSNDSEIYDSNLNKVFDGFSNADFDSFNDKIIIYFYKTNSIMIFYDNFSLFKQFENATLFEKINIDVVSRQHFVIGKKNTEYSLLCSDGKFSILDENFNTNVSNLLDATDFKENYFKFRRDNVVGYMDYNGNVLFEMKY